MPMSTRNGTRLFYETKGDGDPPMVFIHGWCCDRTFFQPQVDYFQESHAVVAMDLRGCGKSEQPEAGYDIPTFADDIASLCGELGLTKPILIGHSLGGMIAIELAARHPSVSGAVVAVDPGPINPTPEARRVYQAFATQLEGPDGDAVRRAWTESDGMFLPTDDHDRKRLVIDTMCSVPHHIATAVIHGVNAWNGVGAMVLCRVPMLVLLSRLGGSNDSSRLRPLKPDVHIRVTVGAGHFHQLEAPDQVNPMIERFLRITA